MLTFTLQTMIDRKFEPLVKRLMMKYLGEMEEEDLIMFVLEHLKDHKGPQKLVEGLEPVRWLSLSLLFTHALRRSWRRRLSSSLSASGDK